MSNKNNKRPKTQIQEQKYYILNNQQINNNPDKMELAVAKANQILITNDVKPDNKKLNKVVQAITKEKTNLKKLRAVENELADGNFQNFDFFLKLASKEALDYALEWAAYYGNLSLVKKTIEAGADVNCSHSVGLQMASRNGHLDVVVYLIELGLLNNLPDPNVLMEAIENTHIDIATYLLSDNKVFGCKIFDIHAEYDLALRTAIQMENIVMVKLLIAFGADVNVANGLPLSIASRINNNNIIQILLAANAQ